MPFSATKSSKKVGSDDQAHGLSSDFSLQCIINGFCLDISDWMSVENVHKFCYLGDMLDGDGECASAATARVRFAWKSFLATEYPY